MKTVTEKAVKDRIKEILALFAKHNALYTFCPMTFGYGESGHPDRIVLINGKYLGIEVKKDDANYHCRPHRKPSASEAHQAKQAARIKAAGGEWQCLHSKNLVWLATWLDAHATIKSYDFSPADIARLRKLVVM